MEMQLVQHHRLGYEQNGAAIPPDSLLNSQSYLNDANGNSLALECSLSSAVKLELGTSDQFHSLSHHSTPTCAVNTSALIGDDLLGVVGSNGVAYDGIHTRNYSTKGPTSAT